MHPVGLTMVFSGLLIVVMGVPLYLEKIPPNALYGFRTPRTMSDERVWYPTNKVSGFDLMWGGLAVALSGLGMTLYYGADPNQREVLQMAIYPLAPLLPALMHTFWFASRFVAEIDAKDEADKAGLSVEEPSESRAETTRRKGSERE